MNIVYVYKYDAYTASRSVTLSWVVCVRYTHCQSNVLFPVNHGVVVVHCDSLVIHKKKK